MHVLYSALGLMCTGCSDSKESNKLVNNRRLHLLGDFQRILRYLPIRHGQSYEYKKEQIKGFDQQRKHRKMQNLNRHYPGGGMGVH